MEKSLISLCTVRVFIHRQHSLKFHSYSDGILHLPLCRARMDGYSVYNHPSACCVEVLVFKLSKPSTVYCIGIVSAEFIYIKVLGPISYLFIRSEAYSDFTMLYFRMLLKISHHTDNLSYTCLIISTKECSSVCNYEGFALKFRKSREVTYLHYHT